MTCIFMDSEGHCGAKENGDPREYLTSNVGWDGEGWCAISENANFNDNCEYYEPVDPGLYDDINTWESSDY